MMSSFKFVICDAVFLLWLWWLFTIGWWCGNMWCMSEIRNNIHTFSFHGKISLNNILNHHTVMQGDASSTTITWLFYSTLPRIPTRFYFEQPSELLFLMFIDKDNRIRRKAQHPREWYPNQPYYPCHMTGSSPRRPLFYMPSHLSELKICKSMISTNFDFIFIFK